MLIARQVLLYIKSDSFSEPPFFKKSNLISMTYQVTAPLTNNRMLIFRKCLHSILGANIEGVPIFNIREERERIVTSDTSSKATQGSRTSLLIQRNRIDHIVIQEGEYLIGIDLNITMLLLNLENHKFLFTMKIISCKECLFLQLLPQ